MNSAVAICAASPLSASLETFAHCVTGVKARGAASSFSQTRRESEERDTTCPVACADCFARTAASSRASDSQRRMRRGKIYAQREFIEFIALTSSRAPHAGEL